MIGKFKLKIDTVRAFFYKIRALFFDFQNRAGEALPPPLLRVCYFKVQLGENIRLTKKFREISGVF